jgi:perosamine synthetase
VSWIPAIRGGEPAFPDGPPAWPPADDDVRTALQRAYTDGSWGRYDGPNLQAVIEALAALVGLPHVSPTCSGTFAVELALRGIGVEAGDEVILGAYDFPGNFRAIEAIGATPVVVDLDVATRCLDVEVVAAACGVKTKAVVASHLHGALVDMRRLRVNSDELGLAIVEDACQCSGAIVQGKPAGTWGDVGTFSFGGSKLLTAGRGGAVFTARADVHQRMKVFSERGNAAFPLSELQAAVLVPQIEKLAARAAVRRRAAARVVAGLATVPELVPVPIAEDESRPDFYKLGILVALDQYGAEAGSALRDAFSAAARAEGIALDAGFRGFLRRGSKRRRQVGDGPIARSVIDRTLVLHHPILLADDATLDRLMATLARLATAFREETLKPSDITGTVKFDGR